MFLNEGLVFLITDASAPQDLQPQCVCFIRKQTIGVTLIILHFICGLLLEDDKEERKNKFLSLLP